MVSSGVVAPLWKGTEVEAAEVEECPICLLVRGACPDCLADRVLNPLPHPLRAPYASATLH